MRQIDADALKAEWPEPTDWMDIDQVLCHITWFRAVIDNMPTIAPVKGRLQQAIEGKTAEETYEFLSWLMYDYAKQWTDSRSGVIEWLRANDAPTIDPVVRCKDCVMERTCQHTQYLGEDGYCSHGERKGEER